MKNVFETVAAALAGLPVTLSADPFFVTVRHGRLEWRVDATSGMVDGLIMDTATLRDYVSAGIMLADRAASGVDWRPLAGVRIGRVDGGLLMMRGRSTHGGGARPRTDL